jgi:ribosomal protein L20A (L18A)
MKFAVSGRMALGKEERTFTKAVEAESENAAREKAYALLGSHNGVKRNKIKIEKVERV